MKLQIPIHIHARNHPETFVRCVHLQAESDVTMLNMDKPLAALMTAEDSLNEVLVDLRPSNQLNAKR